MINKVTEIFQAWRISYSPEADQAELAAERIQICNSCEFKRDNPVVHCSACGCALKKKIYSPVKGACPKGLWNEVDEKLL
jgi:hypothetical protein